ncbi:MAG: thioredoxin domain-containing protein [Pseudomonadota bacterium]
MALAVALTGCASDVDLAATGTQNATSPYTLASPTNSQPPPSAGFNPFADATATATPLRQVIAQPTIAQVLQTGALPEMSWGRADAPVTVVKYASLTCPICRQFQREVFPKLKRTYIDTGKVRFILREFPIGRSSGNATIALRCADPAKYMQLYERFLNQQARWVSQDVRLDAIHAVAKPLGLTRAKFDACLADQKLISDLNWVKDRGRTLGIIGTPNFFIQNKRIKKALDFPAMQKEIDAALTASVASAG